MHLGPFDAFEPSHPVLSELFNRRLQLIALHIKVIHGTNPRNQLPRIPAADSVHQRSTNGAEVVGHCAACRNGLALSIPGELVLAPNMRRSRLIDDKVGRER